MAEKIFLEIATPWGLVFSGEVESVTAPGANGEFGVLPGHTPFITMLMAGVLRFRAADGDKTYVVSSGFIQVDTDRVRVLAKGVEEPAAIDLERARRAHDDAIKRLKDKSTYDADYERVAARLKRSLERMQAASKH